MISQSHYRRNFDSENREKSRKKELETTMRMKYDDNNNNAAADDNELCLFFLFHFTEVKLHTKRIMKDIMPYSFDVWS